MHGGLRGLAHRAILRGLRAPRLPHTTGLVAGHGVANDVVQAVRIVGPRGKQLFGWMVRPPLACDHPTPAVLVHGRGDNTVPAGDAQRLLAASGQARLLLVNGDHDLRAAMAAHAKTLVGFLHAACAVPVVAAEDAKRCI